MVGTRPSETGPQPGWVNQALDDFSEPCVRVLNLNLAPLRSRLLLCAARGCVSKSIKARSRKKKRAPRAELGR